MRPHSYKSIGCVRWILNDFSDLVEIETFVAFLIVVRCVSEPRYTIHSSRSWLVRWNEQGFKYLWTK